MERGGRIAQRATRPDGLFVTTRVRVTGHFLRRLQERGGDPARLSVEGGLLGVAGWLCAIHERDYGLIVPGFGQIRMRVDRNGFGFVAVTYLPLRAS